jgi:alpha-tubulin suppressor-like RCC1 family protein
MSRRERFRPFESSMSRTLSTLCSIVLAIGCGHTRLDPIGLGKTDAGGRGGTHAGAGGIDAGGGTTGGGAAGNDAGGTDGGASGDAGAPDGGGAEGGGTSCAPNTWDDDGDSTTPCTPWTDCAPGSRVSAEGTATTDRRCDPCPKGQTTLAANTASCEPLTVKQIVAGERHTCALLSDGTVKCWGLNNNGQLGSGRGSGEKVLLASAAELVSITNTPGVKVTAIAAGWFHTCALLSDGSAKCWGWNDHGQLGYGNTESIGDDEPPSSVGPLSLTTTAGVTVTALAAGRHTCALLSDGSVKCWGGTPYGYGNNELIGDNEVPSSVGPISVTTTPGVTVTSIACSFYNTCAVLSDGSLKCWGMNGWGELGSGNVDSIGDNELPSAVGPVSVTNTSGVTVTAVAGGFNHMCALLSDGSVKCWGGVNNGTMGVGYGNTIPIGDNESPSSVGAISLTTTPGVVATAIASGTHHACALLSDSSVKCWGWNAHGQLGYGNTDVIGDNELPSSVGAASITTAPGVRVSAIAAGAAAWTTCALLSDGSAKCWGLNTDGQAGYGTTQNVGNDELPSSLGSIVLF